VAVAVETVAAELSQVEMEVQVSLFFVGQLPLQQLQLALA